jgi:hypothetical protein
MDHACVFFEGRGEGVLCCIHNQPFGASKPLFPHPHPTPFPVLLAFSCPRHQELNEASSGPFAGQDRRLLPGTSDYQAAWIGEGDEDEDGSGMDGDDPIMDDDGGEDEEFLEAVPMDGGEGGSLPDLEGNRLALDEMGDAGTEAGMVGEGEGGVRWVARRTRTTLRTHTVHSHKETTPLGHPRFCVPILFALSHTSPPPPSQDDDEEEDLSSLAAARAAAKARRQREQDEQLYPDEVETPADVPAARRFDKYRGLKSFRSTAWDPKESLPREYARVFAFENFKR